MDTELILALVGGIVTLGSNIFAFLQSRRKAAAEARESAEKREKTKLQLRLAEIEAQRERTRGDDEAMKSMLTIMSTFVQSLPQLQSTIENLVMVTAKQAEMISNLTQTVGAMAETSQQILTRADDMHEAVDRRDREAAEDRATQAERHQDVVARLERHSTMIETLISKIEAGAIPDQLRGDITLLVSLCTGISQEVGKLQPVQIGKAAPDDAPDQETLTDPATLPDPKGIAESND